MEAWAGRHQHAPPPPVRHTLLGGRGIRSPARKAYQLLEPGLSQPYPMTGKTS